MSEIDARIAAYVSKLGELKAAFLEDIALQTEITIVRMIDVVQNMSRCEHRRIPIQILMDVQCRGIDQPERHAICRS